MKTIEKLTRRDICSNVRVKYRTAGGTRPDLALTEIGGQKVILKDFRGSDPLFRLLIGPILIARESAALSLLQGVRGVPKLIGRLDRYAILIEHIDGLSLDSAAAGDIPDGFFDELKPIVEEVHKRGVTHCDLRSRGNLMVSQDGKPYMVDFAACVLRGRGLNPFINWLFRQFVIADNHAILMAKKRLTPHLMTEEEEKALATPLPYEEKAQAVGKWFRNVTRKLLTKRVV